MPRRAIVDKWFAEYDNPHKDALQLVRRIILETDPRVDETIKWQTPTFTYEGNIASFNPKSKAHVSLLFHTGATIPGQHPLLIGGGDTARYMSLASIDEVRGARKGIQEVIRAWIASKTASTKKIASTKSPTRKARTR